MKRALTFLLAAVMLLSMAACGGDNSAPKDNSNAPADSAAPADAGQHTSRAKSPDNASLEPVLACSTHPDLHVSPHGATNPMTAHFHALVPSFAYDLNLRPSRPT